MEKYFGNTNEKEMADCLKKIRSSQVLTKCYTNEISLKELANAPICVPSMKVQMNFDASEEDIMESLETGCFAVIPYKGVKHNFPVYPTAFSSLQDRAKLYGMTTRLHPTVLNEGFTYYTDEARVLLQDHLIIAAHSKEYAYLPQDELFDILRSSLMSNFKSYEFLGGVYSKELTVASFSISSLGAQLSAKGVDNALPVVQFTTNDVAKCGANLLAKIRITTPSGIVVHAGLGTQLSTTHKAPHTVADFGDSIDSLLTIFMDGTKKLEALKHIGIKHPVQCFMNIVKEYTLPRNEAELAKQDFEVFMPQNPTAYNLYIALCSIPGYLDKATTSIVKKLDVEENVTRVLTAPFSKLDQDYAV